MHGHNHHHDDEHGEPDFEAKTEFFNKRLHEFVEQQHEAEEIRVHSQ